MLRAILCLCVLFLLSAERAEAGVVNCPTTLTLNPNLAPSAAMARLMRPESSATTRLPVRADQLRILSLVPSLRLPAKSANAAASGGSGVWNFGSPGSSKVVNFSGRASPDLEAVDRWEGVSEPGLRLCGAHAACRRGLAGRSEKHDLYGQRLEPQPIRLRAAGLSAIRPVYCVPNHHMLESFKGDWFAIGSKN